MDPANLSDHDKAMIAKVDGAAAAFSPAPKPAAPAPTPPAPAPAPTRPADVPEKFWDATAGKINTDALLKSYTELERARAAPAAAPTPPAPAPAPGEPPAATPPAPPAPAPGKLDIAKLAAEVEAGGLSPESVAALEAAGFTKDFAENVIQGQKALADRLDSQALEKAGLDKAKFDELAGWAATGLTTAEQDAFNKAMRGPVEQRALFLAGLKAKYEAANGVPPTLLNGGGGGGNAAEGAYASRAEVVVAMSDPRYAKDPAYRADVERRIGLMPNF
jgi:hypothetical protein